MRYTFTAPLWRSAGEKATWYFVTVPTDAADEIEERTRSVQTSMGSVRVSVTIGSTTFATSLFPDSKAASYLLPVKKAVRLAENLDEGDAAHVVIEVDQAPTGR